ncbi:hypothetical protein Scep_025971 [Stephania cephalantha]|uniref:Uncharacterized protein n=1 Tax=Stephania cephalantha TaxID=152367 RepID=A0AAP0EPH5_9MAGN
MAFNRLSLITFWLICSHMVVYGSRLSSQVNDFASVYDDPNDNPLTGASPRCWHCPPTTADEEKHLRLDLNHPNHYPPSVPNPGGPPVSTNHYPPSGPNPGVPPVSTNHYPPSGPNPEVPPVSINRYPPSGPNPGTPPVSINHYPPSGPNPGVPPLSTNRYPPSGPNPEIPPVSINHYPPSEPNLEALQSLETNIFLMGQVLEALQCL